MSPFFDKNKSNNLHFDGLFVEFITINNTAIEAHAPVPLVRKNTKRNYLINYLLQIMNVEAAISSTTSASTNKKQENDRRQLF